MTEISEIRRGNLVPGRRRAYGPRYGTRLEKACRFSSSLASKSNWRARMALKSMRTPFLEARVVVVLYRHPWGETPWTRVEQTAITDPA